MSELIATRKSEHLELAKTLSDEGSGSAGWSDVHLIHQAVPMVDASEIDLSVEMLGHRLSMPLVIAGMTGGHEGATEINRLLARAAQEFNIAIGAGSQRAALEHPELVPTYRVIRDEAPTAMVIGNIGINQVISYFEQGSLDDRVASMIARVDANALAIHLNYLEEAVQPEGQTRARGAIDAIAAVVATSGVPVIAKETGGGISSAAATMLKDVGVVIIDVGGRGGTSFAAIEAERSRRQGDYAKSELGAALATWGIPTAVSVAACQRILPTIAVGGVRSGVDAAKALSLGAIAVGVGRPLLVTASEGEEAVTGWLEGFRLQLRSAMFLTGARRIEELAQSSKVVVGETGEWLRQLNLT